LSQDLITFCIFIEALDKIISENCNINFANKAKADAEKIKRTKMLELIKFVESNDYNSETDIMKIADRAWEIGNREFDKAHGGERERTLKSDSPEVKASKKKASQEFKNFTINPAQYIAITLFSKILGQLIVPIMSTPTIIYF